MLSGPFRCYPFTNPLSLSLCVACGSRFPPSCSSNSIYCRYNVTNPDEPYFLVESLENLIHYGGAYDDIGDDNPLKAIIYAVNQKGRSQGIVVKDFYLESAVENRAGGIRPITPFTAAGASFSHLLVVMWFILIFLFFSPFSPQLFTRSGGTVLTSNSLDSISPILFGVLLTLLVLCFVIFVRVYYIKATATSTTITNVSNDLVSNSKQGNNKQDTLAKVSESSISRVRLYTLPFEGPRDLFFCCWWEILASD